jgi:hypothetical protein
MDDSELDVAREERAIHIGLLLVGVPIVIAAIARGTAIGAGDTLAGALVVLGLVGLVSAGRRSPKLPKAWTRRR